MPLYPERYVYELQAVLPPQENGQPGGNVPLYAVCESMQWEESPDELAIRLQARMRNFNVEPLYRRLSEILECGMPVVLTCDYQDGEGARRIFDGRIWDVRYEDQGTETVTITAYDGLIQLQKSKDILRVFTPTPGHKMLTDLFFMHKVPHEKPVTKPEDNFPGPNILRGASVAEMMVYIFRECFVNGLNHRAYTARWEDGMVKIVGEGGNDPIYYLSYETGVVSVSNEDSIQDLITSVKVWAGPTALLPDPSGQGQANPLYGPEPQNIIYWDPTAKNGQGDVTYERSQSPMVLKFGEIQELVTGGQAFAPTNLEHYAREILAVRGNKVTTKNIVCADVPHMRRGHLVFVNAGPVTGEYVISGIQHSADKRQMTVTIDSHGMLGRKYARVKTPGLLPDPEIVAPMPTNEFGNVTPNPKGPF